MSRIEGPQGSRPISNEVVTSDTSSATPREASLLPPPIPGVDDAASRLARLVIETSHAQRSVARRADDDAERAARAAEDRSVAELHQKAGDLRSSAIREGVAMGLGGLMTITAAGIGARSEKPDRGAAALEAAGKVTYDLRSVLASFGSATATGHDANVEEARAVARRALRASDDGKKDIEATSNLIQKALTFVRDAERTAADAQMAAIRRV